MCVCVCVCALCMQMTFIGSHDLIQYTKASQMMKIMKVRNNGSAIVRQAVPLSLKSGLLHTKSLVFNELSIALSPSLSLSLSLSLSRSTTHSIHFYSLSP